MAAGDSNIDLDEYEGSQKFDRLTSHDKLPKTPDFSEKMVAPRKGSPFILDDFRGSNAYKKP